jgi:hypothetical protein
MFDKNDQPIMCLYGQFDGYPSGHGANLADFLDGYQIVNGLDGSTKGKVANGMGCLAAQMVGHFKDGPGLFYLHAPVPNQDCGQDYEYHVYENKVVILLHDGNKLFDGSLKEFKDFCTAEEIV